MQSCNHAIMLKDFRAFQLAKRFYQQSKLVKIPFPLKDQLVRASSSIALNLAESSGKRTEKERIRYFTIAMGSLRESQAVLELENVDDKELLGLTDQLGAILFKLCRFSTKSSNKSSEVWAESPIFELLSSTCWPIVTGDLGLGWLETYNRGDCGPHLKPLGFQSILFLT